MPDGPRALVRGMMPAPRGVGGRARFDIGSKLGSGSQATVFSAFDKLFDQPVALKVYGPPIDIEAFTRDFRSAADVTHPHVVRVFDLWVEDGQGFLACELFDRELRSSDLTPDHAPFRIRELMDGLSAIHRRGLIHGDIKPSNILVRGERVAFADFGLSALEGATTNGFSGTIRYSAPELFRGTPPNSKTDLFSLGMTLLEVASGVPAQLREVYAAPKLHHPWLSDETRLDQAFGALSRTIRALLNVDPEARRGEEIHPPKRVFVGRTHELKVLDGATARAMRRKSALRIDITGPSGFGKTSLIRAWAETSSAGCAFGFTIARLGEKVPFAVLDGLLESLATSPRLSEDNVRTLTAARLDRNIGSAVAALETLASPEPLILAIDDAQYGDEDSGRALRALVDSTPFPLVLVLAYRPLEGYRHIFLETLSPWRPDAVLPLSGLSDDALREIIAESGLETNGRGRTLVADLGGDPFRATLLRVSGAPEGTEAALLQSVHDLATEVGLLAYAIGGPVPREVLVEATQHARAPAAVTALLDAGLLVRSIPDGSVSLAHERLVAAAWDEISATDRRALHARLAAALSAWGASEEARAQQLVLSGQTAEARPLAEIAAARARERGAFGSAVRFERVVLDALKAASASSKDIRNAQIRLARALVQAGRGEEAANLYLQLGADRGQPIEQVRLQLDAVEALLGVAEVEKAIALLEDVAQVLRIPFPRSFVGRLWRAIIERRRLDERDFQDFKRLDATNKLNPRDQATLRFLTILAGPLGAFESHPEAQPRLLRLARAKGDLNTLGIAFSLEFVYSHAFGFPNPRLPQVDAFLRRREEEAPPRERAFLFFTRAYANLQQGLYAEAGDLLDQALALPPEGSGQDWFVAQARLVRVGVDWSRGRFNELAMDVASARSEWTVAGQHSLLRQLEVFGGFFMELLEGRAQRALQRLRRSELSRAAPSLENLRLGYMAGTLRAAGHATWAEKLLLAHGFVLLPRMAEVFARAFLSWFIFQAVADRPRLSWPRQAFLRTLLGVLSLYRSPSGNAVRWALWASLLLRTGQVRRGRAVGRLARRAFLALDMRPFAAGITDLLNAAEGSQRNTPLWEELGSPPELVRRLFRPPWPEKHL